MVVVEVVVVVVISGNIGNRSSNDSSKIGSGNKSSGGRNGSSK